jgi:hypothetical protein
MLMFEWRYFNALEEYSVTAFKELAVINLALITWSLRLPDTLTDGTV